MKKKTGVPILKIGTYSNDGLGSGLPELDSSSEAFKEMKALIDQNKQQTVKAYKELSLRLGEYIKQKIGTYRNLEEFDEWFWSNKVKFNQIGSKFPKIEDTVFLDAAKEYTEYLNQYIEPSKKAETKITSLSWSGSESQLMFLFNELICGGFINNATKFQDFKAIFSAPASQPSTPIVWMATNLLLAHLLELLQSENLIQSKAVFPLLEELKAFCNKNGTLMKENNLNVAKSTNLQNGEFSTPKRSNELERLIKKLKDLKTS